MQLDLKSYIEAVKRTANETDSPSSDLQNCIISLWGELGEVANLVKKQHFHGHDIDVETYVSELGDCLWYTAWITDLCWKQIEAAGRGGFMLGTVVESWEQAKIREPREVSLPRLYTCLQECFRTALRLRYDSLFTRPTLGCITELWSQLSALSGQLGVRGHLSDIAAENIIKLKKRYPSGFTVEASVNRSM